MQDGKNVPADSFIVYERIMYSFFFRFSENFIFILRYWVFASEMQRTKEKQLCTNCCNSTSNISWTSLGLDHGNLAHWSVDSQQDRKQKSEIRMESSSKCSFNLKMAAYLKQHPYQPFANLMTRVHFNKICSNLSRFRNKVIFFLSSLRQSFWKI